MNLRRPTAQFHSISISFSTATMSFSSEAGLQLVLAIIMVDGKYALQLRDNRGGINAPGMWSLFGGEVESGEAADDAVARELKEELDIHPREYRFCTALKDLNRLLQRKDATAFLKLIFRPNGRLTHCGRVRQFVYSLIVTPLIWRCRS